MIQENITKEELILKLTQALADFLRDKLGTTVFGEYLDTMLAPVITLAVNEGVAAAEEVLEGLTGNNTRPHWVRLVAVASPEGRIALMKAAEQAAIQDLLLLIKQEKQRWIVFKTAISVMLSLLLSLL